MYGQRSMIAVIMIGRWGLVYVVGNYQSLGLVVGLILLLIIKQILLLSYLDLHLIMILQMQVGVLVPLSYLLSD